ncbi:3-hydroxy acyl-CoA dehydratase, partial [Clonorchis sinensis]
WSYLLYSFVTESYSSGNWLAVSSNVEFLLRTFQTLALIEILHACVRLVKSSPVLTALQLMSRVFVVWGIMLPLMKQETIAAPLCIVSWSLAEIVRYVYYALTICNSSIGFVTWLRYTAFTVLYPTGISGELIYMYEAVVFLRKNDFYRFPMPNSFNVSFDYSWFIVVVMLSYIPVSCRCKYTRLARTQRIFYLICDRELHSPPHGMRNLELPNCLTELGYSTETCEQYSQLLKIAFRPPIRSTLITCFEKIEQLNWQNKLYPHPKEQFNNQERQLHHVVLFELNTGLGYRYQMYSPLGRQTYGHVKN